MYWIVVPSVELAQDNSSTRFMIERGRPTSDRTRHVAVDDFYVSECVERGEVVIVPMGTKDMDADMLSKASQGEMFAENVARVTGRAVKK